MPGPGVPRGARIPGKKVEHPFKLLGRTLKFVFRDYKFHFVIVLICIVVSVLASVQGTLFTRTLIDSYILPMIGQENPDFGPLAGAIGRVASFYLAGALANWVQARIMVNVTQGTMRNIRIEMFDHMQSLPIKYFDTHKHGDIMSMYTNDIDTLRQLISQSIISLCQSGFTVVTVFISMITLSIPLTLLTLVMVAVMTFTTGKVGSLTGRYFLAQQKNLGIVNAFIEEMKHNSGDRLRTRLFPALRGGPPDRRERPGGFPAHLLRRHGLRGTLHRPGL